MHVLFVCTGNICRSPTAERLTTTWVTQQRVPELHVSSAGTRAAIGHPIHPESARVLSSLGGDPFNFAARQLTPKMASGADLILTMTTAHRDAVLEVAPYRLHRTFTMTEAARLVSDHGARAIPDLAALRPRLVARNELDIPDPIGQSLDVFAETGTRIANLLSSILKICQPD